MITMMRGTGDMELQHINMAGDKSLYCCLHRQTADCGWDVVLSDGRDVPRFLRADEVLTTSFKKIELIF